ncbi:MAG: hypothetical protein ABL888_03620 [Pirellulaceae bacterium]
MDRTRVCFSLIFITAAIVNSFCLAVPQNKKAVATVDKGKPKDQVELVRQLWEAEAGTSAHAWFDENGNLKHGWVQTSEGFYRQLVDFYDCEETQAELELVGEQMLKYKGILRNWNNSINHLFQQASSNRSADAYRAAHEEYYSAKARYIDELDDLLTPLQRKALSQIQFRFLLRNHGFMLFQKPELKDFLGVKHGIGFQSVDEKVSIDERGYKSLQKEIANARVEASNILLRQFSDEERKAIFRRWTYLITDEVGYSESFRIHLAFEDEFKSLDKLKSPIQKTHNFPTFVMNPAGLFETSDDERASSLESSTYFWLSEMWRKKDSLIDQLRLTDRQVAMIEEFLDAWGKLYAEKTPQIATGEQTASPGGNAANQEERHIVSKELYNRLKSTFSPDQWSTLEGIAERNLERKMGPIWDLLYGSLGQELKLDDADKKKLKEAAKEARTLFEKKTIEIEQSMLDERTEKLPEPAQKKLRELLGPPLQNTPANLSSYVR